MPIFEDKPSGLNGQNTQTFKKFALLAGIGNPLQFQKSVESYTKTPCTKTIFLSDHANMDTHIAEIIKLDMPIICTEKDAIKLKNYPELAHKELLYTRTAVEFYASCFTAANFDTWFGSILPLIRTA